MYVCDPRHLENLETRLALKNVPEALSVPIHLKSLEFDCHRGELMVEDDLNRLYVILPRLTRLVSFSWKMNFMPYALERVPSIRSIKSVHLAPAFSGEQDDYWYKDLSPFLNFRGLTHFYFKTNDLSPGFNKRYIDTFALLIERSPSLESIVLNLFNDTYTVEEYLTDLLLAPLCDDFYAPRLHTFHLLGDVEPYWSEFTSGDHSLHTFLSRHTQIENLAIGCGYRCNMPSKPMNLDDLPRLLPSLRHFSGPLFFCEALINSSLVGQLESLVIMDGNPGAEDLFGPLSVLFDETNPPKLRKLELWARGEEYELEPAVVARFFTGAKALEEFEFRQGVEYYVHFLGALAIGGADNLRRITMDRGRILQCAKREMDPGLTFTWEDIMMDIIKFCPKLELIVDRSKAGRTEGWRVLRQGSSQPKVVYVGPNPSI